MRRFLGAVLVTAIAVSWGGAARADDSDANAVLDKAIKAVGGAEKLGQIKAVTWKSKSQITFNGNENEFTSQVTAQGLDHFRSEFDGEFNGNPVKGVTVLNVDKGWRKFGDNLREMDDEGIAREKRTVYLQLTPVLLLPLKGPDFKTETTGEETIDGKPAAGIKVTGPDGKDFTLYFDKTTGLPVKQVAQVVGFNGEEFTQTTTFADYKDFDGIKKATKVEAQRDGERFIKGELTEFKTLDKVDPETFAEPE